MLKKYDPIDDTMTEETDLYEFRAYEFRDYESRAYESRATANADQAASKGDNQSHAESTTCTIQPRANRNIRPRYPIHTSHVILIAAVE